LRKGFTEIPLRPPSDYVKREAEPTRIAGEGALGLRQTRQVHHAPKVPPLTNSVW